MSDLEKGVEVQNLAIKLFGVTISPLFVLLIVSNVMYFISFILFFDEISLLNLKYYGTSTFTLLLPCFLLFFAVLLHASPVLFLKINKDKESIVEIDYFEILKEQRNPALRKNKTRKIILWILIILSILSLIGSQIYLYIGVFILL